MVEFVELVEFVLVELIVGLIELDVKLEKSLFVVLLVGLVMLVVLVIVKLAAGVF